MISSCSGDRIEHTTFDALPQALRPGDVVVINTSRTLRAAIDARREDGAEIVVHFSTRPAPDTWVVELRRADGATTAPLGDGRAGEAIALPDGALRLLGPHRRSDERAFTASASGPIRLWNAAIVRGDVEDILERHGRPIRYRYVRDEWPIDYYQTVYAVEPGSAEMPSAGRPFTPEIITRLVARGVLVVPIVLHTGVASLEAHEAPYEEYFRVPESTAMVIEAARARGARIIAVGTTVVRALESAVDETGALRAASGWTELVVTPAMRPRIVTGLLTGLHEPRATHLAMLEAIAGRRHVRRAYREALAHRYLWHEFGDVHLILQETLIVR
jgi:S-adenosylmethionine:tRNA ribosyltransferase-isomerase